MRRHAGVLAAVAALALPAAASAHPLGNFTVNRHATIEAAGGSLYVDYVLDLAEIPSFQDGARVRSPRFPRELARRLELTVDGRRAALRPLEHRLEARRGAGGLETLRFEAVYRAARGGERMMFTDRNYAERLGWREIVVRAREGAVVRSASVPAVSSSDELRAYPADLLRSPLNVRTATAELEPGARPAPPPTLPAAMADERHRGGFEALVARGELSLGVVLVSLLVAAFWGAAHALTPGHGKAIVAGYLVGTRGRPLDAILLGGIVTVTHTIGVFALGIVTLLLSRFVVPEALYPWLTLVSGLLVIAVGAAVLRARVRSRSHVRRHGHHHDHEHHHDVERKGLLGVGVAAGLLPCPSALVVLLSAIALHRVGFGLALIVAFSLGLAATITGIGLVAVLARRLFSRVPLDGPLVHALPTVSAFVILVVGLALTARAIPQVV